MKQNTVATLAAMKARGEKISQLTCYDYSTALKFNLISHFCMVTKP